MDDPGMVPKFALGNYREYLGKPIFRVTPPLEGGGAGWSRVIAPMLPAPRGGL